MRFMRLLVATVSAWNVTLCVDGKVKSHWEPRAPIRTERQEVGVAALGDSVYVIGGILADRSTTGIVERYDWETDDWHSVAPLPDNIALHHIGAASAEGKIFAVGGLDRRFRAVATLFEFDPTTGEWAEKAPLLAPRGGAGVASTEDRIFLVGGQDGGTSFNNTYVYFVHEDRWEELEPMPTARNHLAAAIIDNRLFAVGGRAGSLYAVLEMYEFDGGSDPGWKTLPPMPTARAGIAAAVSGGAVYVFGGEGNDDDPAGIFPDVEVYEPCRNRWFIEKHMAVPRHGIGAATIDDYVIVIPGGSEVEGFGTTAVNDALYPGGVGSDELDFLRGDANRDASVDISDGVAVLSHLFLRAVPLPCPDAADADDSGFVNITDGIFILNYLFLGGPEPPSPGTSTPGRDWTPPTLGCNVRPTPCADL